MRNRRGWSLIGVLAALVIFSTIVMFLLRFNHSIEMQINQPHTEHNALRMAAWQLVKGIPVRKKDIGIQRQTVKGEQVVLVSLDGFSYYIIPPNKNREKD